jgi:hypothetical protein
MPTDKQIQANRENAQLSTGPTSDAGRAAVSQNRTTHGLAGEFKTHSDFETEEYKRLLPQLSHEYNTTTTTEVEIISKMVEALIRSNRAVQLQDDCIGLMEDDPDDARARKDLELYIRYQASHDRAYQRYAAELRKFQAELKKAEIGFESQKRREAQDVRAKAQETRRENNEKRHSEQHEITILNGKARLEHQQLLNRKLACEITRVERSQNHISGELIAA